MKQKDTNELKNIFSNLLKENKLAEFKGLMLGLSDSQIKEIIAGEDLFYPIEYNDLEMAKLFVKHGADVNERIFFDRKTQYMPHYGEDVTLDIYSSPLYKAAYKKQTGLAKLLVENGAKVNEVHTSVSKDCYDAYTRARHEVRYSFPEPTALDWFVVYNDHEMVKLLMDKGAKVGEREYYVKNGYSFNQMYYGYNVKKAQDVEMFKLLLGPTLDLDEKSHPGINRDTLEMAVKFGDKESVKATIDIIENKEAAFNQLLLFAAQYEDSDLVKHALNDNEINLNAKYNDGTVFDSVLEVARKANNIKITNLLLNEISYGDLKKYLDNKSENARIKYNQAYIRQNIDALDNNKHYNGLTIESVEKIDIIVNNNNRHELNKRESEEKPIILTSSLGIIGVENLTENSPSLENKIPNPSVNNVVYKPLLKGNHKKNDCCNIL